MGGVKCRYEWNKIGVEAIIVGTKWWVPSGSL